MDVSLDKLAGPEGGRKGMKLARHWITQLEAVKDDAKYKNWLDRAQGIEKRYRDERSRAEKEGQRRYNALWSNTEILKPALYGKCPVPIAERRFKDKDPVGRFAATILERGLRNEIEINGFDRALKQCVTDYLLPGRGAVWVRYEPEIEDGASLPIEAQTDLDDDEADEGTEGDDDFKPVKLRFKSGEEPDGDEAEGSTAPEVDDPDVAALKEEEELEKLHSTGDRIIRESTPVDYVPWRDFFTLPLRARTWSEVTAVVKRVYMSRDQLKKRFGKTIGNSIPLKRDDRGELRNANTASPHNMDEDKGQVYEIWDAGTKKVYWIAEGYDWLCDRREDPLKLENFFPTPEPLYANQTNDNMIPVPEYIEYQDQALQVDELTQRIALLTKACKVAGVYNAAAKDIQRLLQEGVENQLIPVDDWAAFAENGGIQGAISFLPIDEIIKTINELMMVKAKQIEEMDRLTGISDIMSGTTDARETLGGQRLKSNYSGTRLSSRQNDIARLARDTVRIMADIMSQHFSPQSLIEVSGALYAEGLGPNDMPKLTDIQAMLQAPPKPQPGQPGPQAPGAPPQQPPQGGNVVPFQRPGMPPAPGMPPGPPQGGPAPMGSPQMSPQGPMGMPQPPIDPREQAKIESLAKIASAIQLMRNERLRGFRVDIEVDSTIFPDQAQDKADRVEFVKEVTGFLQIASQMGTAVPESLPLLAKLLQFGVRGFRVGRDLETAIEEFTDHAIEMVKNRQMQQANQPDYAAQKAQAEIDKLKAQAQNLSGSTENDKMKIQADVQKGMMDVQADREKAQAEVQRQQIENQGEAFNSAADMQIKQMEMRMKEMELQLKAMEMQLQQRKAETDMQMSHQQMQMQERQSQREAERDDRQLQHETEQNAQQLQMKQQDVQLKQQQHQQTLEQQQEHHDQSLEHQEAAHTQALDEKKKANEFARMSGPKSAGAAGQAKGHNKG